MMRLWQQMIPEEWLRGTKADFLYDASRAKLSGGSMVNVVQRCSLLLHNADTPVLTAEILQQAIDRELTKEGKLIKK